MQIATRRVLTASSLAALAAMIAAGCGGGGSTSPTAPSNTANTAGATIAGTVSVTTGAPQGLTVAVVGASASATVDGSGYFQLGGVPTGNVQLRFKDATADATAQVSNVAQNQFIELQVQVNGSNATILNETRSNSKISICHRSDNGAYHLIDISSDAEAAHRAHGDAKPGEPVPGTQRQVFDQNCVPTGPAVKIKKYTNGEDANDAPGPSIKVGNTVTWTYDVTNTGTINLTGIAVTDDRGVSVTCSQTSLTPGQTVTCTGSGVATLGQYTNTGTVSAGSASGTVTDSDISHYLGVNPTTDSTDPKVQLCHKTGAGFYVLIEVSVSAEAAHRAHGDGKIGEPVPGMPGKFFGPGCSVR